MARNAPGSFAVRVFSYLFWLLDSYSIFFFFCHVQLFGASAVTKEYVLGVTDYSKATWGQNFIASIAGAVASITVAAPLDTVKTRIQNANFERKVHGMTVVKDLIKNEGASAFFKGLTPKVSLLQFPRVLATVLTPRFFFRRSWSLVRNWCLAIR